MSAIRCAALAAGSSFELVVDPVTTTQLVRYAGASGDYNRIHYDLPYAEAAGLGGVIAHGMLTMAFMGRALTDWAGEDARVKRIAAKFTAPVRPGDVVVVNGVVTAKQDGQSVGTEISCDLTAQVAGRTVAVGDAIVAWRGVADGQA